MKLKDCFENTIIIEKSKFITYLSRIESEEEAKEYIMKIKKIHPNASHHCSAFICFKNNTLQRSNDDGEPKGTAGSPMLNVLNKYGIENTVAVVVRYFGGIKLGAGGLIRAYSSSVSKALDLAPKVETINFHQYIITVPYDLNSKVEHYIRSNSENFEVTYDLSCTYIFTTNIESVYDDLSELSSGRFLPEFITDIIIEKEIEKSV